ncbi:hypothetical protein CYY_005512 [Polysphondylium violaceum]|uniref:Uncharacterized protein n=1 Tax=Polysphondylium violaceum TaxID=133409 RepID=A0A8J4PUX9_9MYCE|nr:hypothetical protein CYY_005512 [Polysphondylium violaceum]
MVFRKILSNLTPKMGNKNYYKGRGVYNPGKVNSKGRFHITAEKAQVIHAPDLTDFELKPYVSRHAFPISKEEVDAKKQTKLQNRMKRLEHSIAPNH